MKKNLYKAIFETKKILGPTIHVDAKGQYGSYASLEQVLRIVEPVAQQHGLLILQYPTVDPLKASACLTTLVVHIETGESLEAHHALVTDKPGPQGLGAAETYARRRSIMDIFGLATEDDPDAFKQAQNSPNRQQREHYMATGRAPAAPATASKPQGLLMKQISMFKKYAGMKYGDIPLEDLLSSADWLRSEAKKSGKALSVVAQEFCADVEALQNDTGFADDIPF